MIQQSAKADITEPVLMPESRVVHDLRSPLVIAFGYLDELRIFKLRLLSQLSAESDGESQALNNENIAAEVEAEMSLCMKMINDSLEELDAMISDLRGRV